VYLQLQFTITSNMREQDTDVKLGTMPYSFLSVEFELFCLFSSSISILANSGSGRKNL